jgi:uncharacterized protein (DUF302 family)
VDVFECIPSSCRGWSRHAAEGFAAVGESFRRPGARTPRRYKILGACNPPFARDALETDLAAALLLPCNVVVYEGEVDARS